MNELDTMKRKAADREAAIQKAAAREIDGLTMQVEEVQRQLQAKIKDVAELSKAASSSSKEMTEALMKAKQETEEAIQAGNKKYNEMLAQRMKMEDELLEKISVSVQMGQYPAIGGHHVGSLHALQGRHAPCIHYLRSPQGHLASAFFCWSYGHMR